MKMNRILGFILGIIIFLSIFGAIGSMPVYAETENADGTILNAAPNITVAFKLSSASGTGESWGPEAYDFEGANLDVVIFPQFDDQLNIEGTLRDFNGLSAGSASGQDEFLNDTVSYNNFHVVFYQDQDGDGDVNDADYNTIVMTWGWNSSDISNGDLDSTATAGEAALGDAGGAEAGKGVAGWQIPIPNVFQTNVTGWYTEAHIYIEDNDGYDLRDDGGLQAAAMAADAGTGGGGAGVPYSGVMDLNKNNSLNPNTCANNSTVIKLAFYCQRVYKVIGLFDYEMWEATTDTENACLNAYRYYPAAEFVNPAVNWTFKTVRPTGAVIENVTSGWDNGNDVTTGTVTNHTCLVVQWLRPAVAGAYLALNFNADFFFLSLLPTLSIATLDINYSHDDAANGTINNAEIVDPNAYGTQDGNDLGTTWRSFQNVNNGVCTWGGELYLDQYDCLWVYYSLNVPAVIADGYYTTTYSLTSMSAAGAFNDNTAP